ncbi:hypothetical protein N24_2878 [Corynebacterium suranareeae]|uniref:Ribbon-helix-helix protein CopG domain-containing protein n=1 Tax=Corynebacterium suranareeae TaxID=2506452 RepID=A0A169S4R6_9CORY|nr:hypothetical protein [Corynebacterium suranareeae]BAU97140.1 hypothetical protein N24_2878 [Corynebacterium suranareeae]
MSDKLRDLAEYYDSGDFSEEAREAETSTALVEPSGASEPMDSFTVRLSISVLESVRSRAAERNESTESVIRRMIEDGVAARQEGQEQQERRER